MCGDNAVMGALAGAGLAYLTGGTSLLAMGAGAAAGGAMGSMQDNAIKQQKDALAQQKQADDAAIAQANQQAQLAGQNAADSRLAGATKPQIAPSLDAANKLYASQGVGSTSSTGPTGVDPSSLLLGKKTLLGG